MRKKRLALALVIVAAAIGGCGRRNRHYVTGTVRYPDGAPVTEGRLIIQYVDSKPIQAQATIRKDGSFRVGELKDGDGMQAGEVRVGVAAIHYAYENRGDGHPVYLCAEKYLLPKTSGIVFEVPKQLRWEIVVERPKEPAGKPSAGRPAGK